MHRFLRRTTTVLVAALALVTFASCTDVVPTGPRAGGSALPPVRLDVSGGSYALPVPADNSPPATGGLGWTDTGYDIPDSSWAYLSATGSISISAIAPSPYCPTNCIYAGMTAGPGGVQISGQPVQLRIRVRLRRGTTYTEHQLAYPGTNGTGLGTAWVAGWFEQGGRLEVFRGGLNGSWSTTSDGGEPHPYYGLAGAEQVQLNDAPPAVVTASRTEIGSGDSTTFRASWVHGDTASLHWYWRAGDTLATPAGLGGAAIWACQNKGTCVYRPTSGGRMYVVFGGAGRFNAKAGSPAVRVLPWRFNVSCTPGSVTRGAVVTCKGWVYPAKAFRVLAWSARDTTGSAATVPVDTSFASGATYTLTGPAATPTTVVMFARVALGGGSMLDVADSAVFGVTPRAWPAFNVVDPPLVHYVDTTVVTGNDVEIHIPAADDVRHGPYYGLHHSSLPRSVTDPAAVLWDSLQFTRITVGPNVDYWMAMQSIRLPRSNIFITPALVGSTPFRAMQSAGPSDFDDPYCPPDSVAPFYQIVRRHEGEALFSGQPAENSHEGVLRYFLTTHPLGQQFEGLLGRNWGPGEGRARAQAVYDAVKPALFAEQKQFDTDEYGDRFVWGTGIRHHEARFVGCYFRTLPPL